MLYEELIHTEEKDGFTIHFYACEENEELFLSGDEEADAELAQRIQDGKLTWFCAKVTASKESLLLAETYLGGCCYASPEEFVVDSGYYNDMVSQAIAEAKELIAKLCKAA